MHYRLPLTTKQKEWHYTYFTRKKVSKVPYIISHFKNDTMSAKNHSKNYVLAIQNVRGLFHVLVFVRLFTKSGNSTLSWWLTLTCASMHIADGWLKSTCLYSYEQSHVIFLIPMVYMLLSLFLLLYSLNCVFFIFITISS